MPISRKQFELGINDAIEQRMHDIQSLLAEQKNAAFSEPDLRKHFGVGDSGRAAAHIHHALQKLTDFGAIETRYIGHEAYYAYKTELTGI